MITEDDKFKEDVEQEQKYFVQQIKPKNINSSDPENVTYKGKKEFERLCVILESNGFKDVKQFTVMKFYTIIKYYEDRKKKDVSSPKKRK